jgi:tetratricopeptide (TPR) repeat protein
MLGATHVLTGALHIDNNGISIHARLTDARSSLPVKDWQARYAPNELRNISLALAGVVTETLRLPPLGPAKGVSQAAYKDFTAGVGLSRRSTGIDAAIPLLERAVAADSQSPLTHARLAEAEILKYRLTTDTDWLERSKISLQQAELLNPDLALVRLVSGMINEYEGNYDKAESDLQRALDLEPLNGDVWRRLGRVYQENNQSAEALAAYRKAIEAQPDYFKNYQDLCSLYVEQANYSEAIQQCGKVAQLAPDLSDAHFALAIPYCLSERNTECEAELRLALKLDPASTKALESLGAALSYQSRFGEAISLFSRAVKAGPATVSLYLNLGTTLQLNGRTPEALQAYRHGVALAENELQINPRDAFSRSALALLCAWLGQRGRARSEAAQALRLASGSAEIATMLIRVYEVLGDRQRAFELTQDLPDSAIRLINRSPDLAALRGDSRFQQLIVSRHIQ